MKLWQSGEMQSLTLEWASLVGFHCHHCATPSKLHTCPRSPFSQLCRGEVTPPRSWTGHEDESPVQSIARCQAHGRDLLNGNQDCILQFAKMNKCSHCEIKIPFAIVPSRAQIFIPWHRLQQFFGDGVLDLSKVMLLKTVYTNLSQSKARDLFKIQMSHCLSHVVGSECTWSPNTFVSWQPGERDRAFPAPPPPPHTFSLICITEQLRLMGNSLTTSDTACYNGCGKSTTTKYMKGRWGGRRMLSAVEFSLQ